MSPASAAMANSHIIMFVSSGILFVSGLGVLGAALGVSLTASTSTSTTASACASNSMASNTGSTAAASAAVTTNAGTASSIVTTTASTISANGITTGAPTTISATATSTYCVTTPITSAAVTASPMPGQCTNATLISDATRSPGSPGGYYCDASGPLANPGWFQFTGPGGMILANCVVPSNLCGAQGTGWYSGAFPSTAGTTVAGTVCFNWSGNSCYFTISIQVTNCNGYYVFYLTPPAVCNLRYCTV